LPADFDKPVQRFWVQPGRDTVLYGAEGTILAVPADAFEVPGRPGQAVGAVELQVREFYALADILLQNLSTTSGAELLETGGMLQVEARTATGQRAELRPGAELLLRMPTKQRLPGMQLFAGVPAPAGGLDWQRPRPAPRPDEFRGRGVIFPGRPGAFRQQLRRNIRYSWADYQQLRQQPRNAAQRRALRGWAQAWMSRPRLLAVAQLHLQVDARGKVRNVLVDVEGDSAGVLLAGLRRAAEQLPSFRPAYLQKVTPPAARPGQAGRMLSEVPRRRRGPAPRPTPRMPAVGSAWALVGFTRDGRVAILGDNQGAVGTGYEGRVGWDQARQRLESGQIGQVDPDSLSTYLFSAVSLGWMNCDRFLQSSQPRVLFTVETGAGAVRTQLVFRRYRSVLAGLGSFSGQAQFAQLPKGEEVTIVAIKQENGQTYLALQPARISPEPVRGLQFRPVTPAELRAALSRLESGT
jgi:hypothetical protein